jgi:hypothetical protein
VGPVDRRMTAEWPIAGGGLRTETMSVEYDAARQKEL